MNRNGKAHCFGEILHHGVGRLKLLVSQNSLTESYPVSSPKIQFWCPDSSRNVVECADLLVNGHSGASVQGRITQDGLLAPDYRKQGQW
jgi:predicted amino acid dehydrogenase